MTTVGRRSRWGCEGRVVVITGAARGIGAATARLLIERGARVALLDRDEQAVARLAAELGPRARGVRADVTDRAGRVSAMQTVVAVFGGIDVVVANAGVSGPCEPIATIDSDAFEQVVEINLLGVWRTVRAALPYVVARRGTYWPSAQSAP